MFYFSPDPGRKQKTPKKFTGEQPSISGTFGLKGKFQQKKLSSTSPCVCDYIHLDVFKMIHCILETGCFKSRCQDLKAAVKIKIKLWRQ